MRLLLGLAVLLIPREKTASLTGDLAVNRDPDCVFCKIITGDIHANVVSESELALAFLDVGPLADGHLLVIPLEHHESLLDLSPGTCAEIAQSLPWLGRALVRVTGATGFNVLQNNGAVAGQVINHVHFHLIPRFEGDGLGFRWKSGTYAEGKAAELAEAYQTALRGGG